MSEKEKGNEFRPDYQRGRTSVEHRNIDAAGEAHPFGDEPQAFEADLRHLIRKVADDLYQSWEATVREYLANAETATLKIEEYLDDPSALPYDDVIVEDGYEPKIEVTWNRKEETLTIKDNGIGMAASEVDEIFRQIGHSAARDDGTKSGQFGMGALSFVKLVGLDNAMIMTSHSRLNDDNASYYVTLAGVEPIRGSLDQDEYGTKFQMTPDGDYEVRQAVEKYAEWMRVPVLYVEYDESGQEVYNEDWGDKKLYDEYDDNRICLGLEEPNAFEAFCSPESSGQTLLLSMDIGRNDGRRSTNQHGAPFPFDVRLLDESGKVIKSSNGNEGLMPCPRSDYESMLVESREPFITEDLLNNGDIIGQTVESGPNAGSVVVAEEVLASNEPLPPADYITRSDLAEDDEPGETEVLIGPNQGRVLVSEEEWESMDEGRAGLYVPEDELADYDLDTGEGDLTLPEPTSDRDRLQEHETFWKFIGQQFAEQFDEKVDEVYELIDGADDPLEKIMELEPENLSLALRGIREIPTGRRQNLVNSIENSYGTVVSEDVADLIKRLYDSAGAVELVKAIKNSGLDDADYDARLDGVEDVDGTFKNAMRILDTSISSGHAKSTSAANKSNRRTIYVPKLVNSAHPDGEVYMAKSTGGAFKKKARIAWDLHDDNEVVVVDDYEKWSALLGWKKLKDFPHGKNSIKEQLGDKLSSDLLKELTASPSNSKSTSSSTSSSSTKKKQTPPNKETLNLARGTRHRKRRKWRADKIKELFEDDKTLGSGSIDTVVLFPTPADRNMTDHWWVAGSKTDGSCAIATCNKRTYDYLADLDGVWHIDDYIEQASEYKFPSSVGMTTLPDLAGNYVLHILSAESQERFMQETVIQEMPSVMTEYMENDVFKAPEMPEPEDMVYAPITQEDVFWLRPLLHDNHSHEVGDSAPIVVRGNVKTRDVGKSWSCSSDYRLYSRARLPNWDSDCMELDTLDQSSYRLSMDDGVFEIIETFGELHDMGEKPFSESPKARWT